MQLSVALQGIVTQQLLPTADGQGRTVAAEVLVPTPAVRNLIREGKTHQIYSALQTGGTHGMQTMDAALAQLVREHKITRELAEARSSAPEELRRLHGHGAGRRRTMATFAFKALDLAGASTKGEIEAGDKQAVAAQLRSRGLIVVDIEEQVAGQRRRHPRALQEGQGRRARHRHAPARRRWCTRACRCCGALRASRSRPRTTSCATICDRRSARTSRPASRSRTRSRKHPDVFNELYVAMVAGR